MNSFKTSRILVALPFFLVGAFFLGGAIWLAIERLLAGLVWDESDGFTIGAIIVLVIFGGAMLQFARNALFEGYAKESKPLIGPVLYYIIGVFILVPGLWSYFEGSSRAFLVAAVGAASIGYGINLSLKRKRHKDSRQNEQAPS